MCGGWLMSAAGAAGVDADAIGSSSVFCNECFVVCAWFCALVEAVVLVAEGSGVAA